MSNTLKTVNPRAKAAAGTPQAKKAVKGQKKNAAGGYTFKTSDLDRAKRFLILGSESNFYTPGEKLSEKNAKNLIRLAEFSDETSAQLVDLIVKISVGGRAPKADPALFALAIASSHGSKVAKQYARSKLSTVARTGTHLFLFVGYVLQFRGWGRGLRNAVANWYLEKDVNKLALQVLKYKSREGFTHRDLFRLTHPVPEGIRIRNAKHEIVSVQLTQKGKAFEGLGAYIVDQDASRAPALVQAAVNAHKPGADIPYLVRNYSLTWEMLPTESLNDKATWEALLDGNLPLGALLRQLPRLTRLGLLQTGSKTLATVVKRLTDPEELKRARIHPIALLTSMKVYGSGGAYSLGANRYRPEAKILEALDKAFYLAFKNVEATGARTLLALDVSGSMDSAYQGGVLTAREITGALALVTAATEPNVHTIGFTANSSAWNRSRSGTAAPLQAGSGPIGSSISNLESIVSPSRRLDDVIESLQSLPMGGTDCSLPMLYALEAGLEIDVFQIYTDNETWAGTMHPFEALKKYRDATGIPAKLIVLSTESSRSTIVEPSDPGSLDIAGFDSAVPELVRSFIVD